MQTTALLNYPELIVAGLLGLLVFARAGKEQSGAHWPLRLANVATAVVLTLPDNYIAWIRKALVYAGRRSNQGFGDFACWKIYPPLLLIVGFAVAPLYAVIFLLFFVFLLPDFILFILVQRRQEGISLALPQALDLMVLCVDAGLGLDATLQRVSTDDSGVGKALNEELAILSREILLGVDREKAYQDLYLRTGSDELKTIGSALNQASKLGLSIAKILRAQSDLMRKKASQKAEERALKMPIFMAFPLWFCIMPALLLLVLGPSLIRFYYALRATSGF